MTPLAQRTELSDKSIHLSGAIRMRQSLPVRIAPLLVLGVLHQGFVATLASIASSPGPIRTTMEVGSSVTA